MHTRLFYLKKHPECALVWQNSGVVHQVFYQRETWVIKSADFTHYQTYTTTDYFDSYYALLDHMRHIQYNMHYWVMIPSKDFIEKQELVHHESNV